MLFIKKPTRKIRLKPQSFYYLVMGFLMMLHLTSFIYKNNQTKDNKSSNTCKAYDIFLKSYPFQIKACSSNFLLFKDGTKILIDDSNTSKNLNQMLGSPDLKDMLYYKYQVGKMNTEPTKNHDPGRVRVESFFKQIYGGNKAEVEKNLVYIKWLPETTNRKLRVTSINNVDGKLKQVSQELDQLPDSLKKYITGIAGSFNWRKIAGTKRLSPHSFGIAIDINVEYANYWKWDLKSEKKMQYKNRIPWHIIQIFEEHGFIWGGKWYHYDTMHFEYRPELLKQ